MKKKILIVFRHDAKQKGGGDVNLLNSYTEKLNQEYDCEKFIGIPKAEDLLGFDAVLCANIDRPIEAYCLLRLCEKNNIVFMIYALHHNNTLIRSYLKSELRGFKGLVAKVAKYNPVIYEQFLWLIRSLYQLITQQIFLPIYSVKRAQFALVGPKSVVLASTKLELDRIEKDIAKPVNSKIVPHVIDSVDSNINREIVPKRIIIPGRIEPRKNLLLAIKLAKKAPNFNFVIVGNKSPSEHKYYNNVLGEISTTDNCLIESNLTGDEFYSYLNTADLVITTGWFEVISLIELYCGMLDIPLLSPNNSYLSEYGFTKHESYETNNLEDLSKHFFTMMDNKNEVSKCDYPIHLNNNIIEVVREIL